MILRYIETFDTKLHFWLQSVLHTGQAYQFFNKNI